MWDRKFAYRALFGKYERDHLEDTRVDGRIILKWIFKTLAGGVGWIDLAQNRDRSQAVVNAVMNLLAP